MKSNAAEYKTPKMVGATKPQDKKYLPHLPMGTGIVTHSISSVRTLRRQEMKEQNESLFVPNRTDIPM
jgi:hypothetical protein